MKISTLSLVALLTCACTEASASESPPSTRSQPQGSFEFSHKSSIVQNHLAPQPRISLTSTPQVCISDALINELTLAADQAHEVGKPLILTKPNLAGKGVSFFVEQNSGLALASASQDLGELMVRCLESTDDLQGVEALLHLVTGGASDNAIDGQALALGKKLKANWRKDLCTSQQQTLDLSTYEVNALKRFAEAMDRAHFKSTTLQGRALMTSIRALYGLFYHPGGVWTVSAEMYLSEAMDRILSKAALDPSVFQSLDNQELDFYRWCFEAQARDLSEDFEFLKVLQTTCEVVDNDPFRLDECFANHPEKFQSLEWNGNNYYYQPSTTGDCNHG